jgi:predicted ATPase
MPPKLPRKIKRTEANVDALVAQWLRRNHPHRNWALEVKIKGNRLAPHQKKALEQVEKGTFLYKIPDQGRRNPFDYVYLGDADTFVCTVKGKDVHCDLNGGVYDYDFKI